MSANVYSIESLLVGKRYYSKTLTGEIVDAQKDERAVWYEGCESYLVEVKSDLGKYTYRTVAVKVSDL
jgi:hypothetical protein